VVVGISCDTPAENKAFKDKFNFPFDLLSDEDRAVSIAYGAAANAQQRHPSRISYLIGPDRTITKVYGKVSPSEHPREVLADLG
jgi:peroxiredoxin Q/BCP